MIITIATEATSLGPATDLGFLLHKHPDRLQSFELSVGTAHVCYPEATVERCTAALLLEVDPVGLVRGRRRAGVDATSLGQYVNDRPYAASSLLSTALTKVFRTAMTGRCDARPELAASSLPLEIGVPALPCRGGVELAARIFEPLGWTVDATPVPLDPTVPEWGDSRYVSVRLTGRLRLADALNHLYVLLPVLDDSKHYWVGTDEVEKLIRAGVGWLGSHPERELISRRYLRHHGQLTRAALARLAEVDDLVPEQVVDADDPGRSRSVLSRASLGSSSNPAPSSSLDEEERLAALLLSTPADDPGRSRSGGLAEQRRDAVLAAVRASGARRVGDLGCGDGSLLPALLADRAIEHVLAADVSVRSLELAARRIGLEQLSETRRSRISLVQTSLVYADSRLADLDAAVLMEVIEHVDPSRLPALERCVFGTAAPRTVIVTTPNVEYNVRYPALPPGERRHRDHRFEWTRGEFESWAARTAATFGYAVRFAPVGPVDPELGAPTQLAVFAR